MRSIRPIPRSALPDTMTVRGQSMYATEVHRCEDLFGRVHHWEIKVR